MDELTTEAVTDDAGEDDDEADQPQGWLYPYQKVLLALALLFLAGVVGYNIGQPDAPGDGSAKVGFMRDMILHHEQAVEMSNLLIDSPAEPSVHIYAHDIVIAQQYEIGLMDGFLARWGKQRGTGEGNVMGWMGMPVPAARMPGLASAEEMEAFKAATGPDKEAMFIRLMKKHHQGGVHMAQGILERTDDQEVKTLATNIIKAQQSEIAEMEETRERLGLPA
jgi:uncharacterized protein (DUF305 family)